MQSPVKNKILTWMVILLLIANAVTITMFWLGRKDTRPGAKDSPQEFLVKELKLNAQQQEQFSVLVKEHRKAASALRPEIKKGKESLFELIKNDGVPDSIKQAAARKVSLLTEQLDLLTLSHFQKLRLICTPDQQQKFDSIIKDVISMMGQQRPPPRGEGRPLHEEGPLPEER